MTKSKWIRNNSIIEVYPSTRCDGFSVKVSHQGYCLYVNDGLEAQEAMSKGETAADLYCERNFDRNVFNKDFFEQKEGFEGL